MLLSFKHFPFGRKPFSYDGGDMSCESDVDGGLPSRLVCSINQSINIDQATSSFKCPIQSFTNWILCLCFKHSIFKSILIFTFMRSILTSFFSKHLHSLKMYVGKITRLFWFLNFSNSVTSIGFWRLLSKIYILIIIVMILQRLRGRWWRRRR